VIAEGPCGGLLARPCWTGPVLLIAGGIGITPLRALFATCPGGPVTLVYRGHAAADLLFHRELDDIAERRHATVHYLVGSRHDPANELTPQQIARLCGHVSRARVYVCGSAGFVRHVHSSLSRLGIHKRNVLSESFQLA
jgi:ferredoxin-NADP reductase